MRPWKLLNASLLISAPPWLKVFCERVELPNGRVLDDFYRVVLPDFAVIVAVTPDRRLVMVRGYKHGLGRITLTAPAGIIEPGESPLVAAQRELLEETGYTASEWVCLGHFMVDGNHQCGTTHLFLARNARWVTPSISDGLEEVEVELMSPHCFVQNIREGDIALLASISAIALAMVNGLE